MLHAKDNGNVIPVWIEGNLFDEVY
jgi:hypothetical protein